MTTATHLPTKLAAAEMRELLGLEPNAYLCDRITTFSCVWVRQSDEWWIKTGGGAGGEGGKRVWSMQRPRSRRRLRLIAVLADPSSRAVRI